MFTETQRIILGSWFVLSMSCLFFPFMANNLLPTKIAMSLILSNVFSFSIFIGIINLLLELIAIPFLLIKNAITRRKELIKRTKDSLKANEIIEDVPVEETSIKESIEKFPVENLKIEAKNDSNKQIPEVKSLDGTLERLKKLNKTLEENRKRRLSENLTRTKSMKTNFKFDDKKGRD